MAEEFEEVVEGEAEELPQAPVPPPGAHPQAADQSAQEISGELQFEPDQHDGPPAIAEVRPLERLAAPVVPAAQAAALAATGFVAGAAAAAIVRRRATRKLGRRRHGGRAGLRRTPDGVPVVSTHTYLIRVQVLGRPAE